MSAHWLWEEAEDFLAGGSRGGEILDDWGAAAQRFVRLIPGASIYFHPRIPEAGRWDISLRSRCLAPDGKLQMRGWLSSVTLDIPQSANGKQWLWTAASLWFPCGKIAVQIAGMAAEGDLDGLFLARGSVGAPRDLKELTEMLGPREAEECVSGPHRHLPGVRSLSE